MVTDTLLSDALALSPADRMELMDRLWESLASDPAAFPLTDEQKAELDHRLEDMDRNPTDESPWSEVEARLRRRK